MCTIDNTGNITCGTNSVLTTATGYTQAQIDSNISASVSSGLSFNSPLSKSGATVSIDLATY